METKNVKISQRELVRFLLSIDSDKLDDIAPSIPDEVVLVLAALGFIKNHSTEAELENYINSIPDDEIKLSIPSEIEKELFNNEDDVENKKPRLIKMIEDYFNGGDNRTYIMFVLDDDNNGDEVATYYLHREDDISAKLHWLLLKAQETGRDSKYLYYCVFDDIGEDILFESMSIHEMLWSLIFE